MQVIKDKKIIEDDFVLLRELDADAALPEANIIVPFAYWQANRDELIKRGSNNAIWINGDVEVEEFADDLQYLSLIALDFPAFKDGRCYSHARLLRERYDYQGDIRAIGDVLRDQLFFMQRCGINSFVIREDKDIEDALKGLEDFSVRYQTAADGALPVYKLR